MDVRVIIACRPDERCRVSVVSARFHGHVWRKEFDSKHICLIELRNLGLLTAVEGAEVQARDFDERDATLIFHSVAEPEALLASQFEQVF